MWKYYYENCCSDNVVATYTNDQGREVLEVYEARGCFYTRPLYSFLDSTIVDYKKATPRRALSVGESISIQRLKNACKIIEGNYNAQVRNIKKIIG